MTANARSKEIERILTEVLKPHGFRKAGRSWFRETAETILKLSLSKDRFRTYQHYIDLQLTVKALAKGADTSDVHVFGRNYTREAAAKAEVEACLNINHQTVASVSANERLRHLTESEGVPFWLHLGSLEDLRQLWKRGDLSGFGVARSLQTLLNAPPGFAE